MNILYITYDGLLEPLGQSQVLAYQEKLGNNFNIILFSYEKSVDLKNTKLLRSIRERLSHASVKWIYRKYHKFPSFLSTFYDLFFGTLHCSYLVWRYQIKIIHARSYPPALIALVIKKLFGIQFIFDMRGFWADERIDGELWESDSKIYKLTKWFEKKFLLDADHVVSLTNAAVKEISHFKYLENHKLQITVIPTCADLNLFKPIKFNKKENFTLGYLGTAGTWYLFNHTVESFAALLDINPKARILIINRGEHEYIKKCLFSSSIPRSSVDLISADYSEVPKLISQMDASIFFIKPSFSKQSSAPTKLAELLGCGIPCLVNSGVGDMAKIINSERVGVTLKKFEKQELRNSLIKLISLTREKDIEKRCVQAAHRFFSLEEGVLKYKKIYEELI